MSSSLDARPAAHISPDTFTPSALAYPQDLSTRHQPSVNELARAFQRRWWVIVLLLVAATAAGLYVSQRTVPLWRAHAQLVLVHPSQNNGNTTQLTVVTPTDESVDTQMTMLQDHELAARTLSKLDSDLRAQGKNPDAEIGMNADQLVKAVSVSNPRDTDIIDLYVDANSPDRAQMLADAMCDSFITWKKEIAARNTDDALASLEVRANRAQVRMLAAEKQQLQFENSHHVVDVSNQASAILGQYNGAQAQVLQLQQDLYSEQAKLKSLGTRLSSMDSDIRNGTGVRDDTLVLSLQTQLNQLEMDRANTALQVTSKYPGLLPVMDAKIKAVKQRLSQAVQNTLDNKRPSLSSQGSLFESYKDEQTSVLFTQAKLTAALDAEAKLKQQTERLPETVLTDSRLARQVDLTRTLYSSLQAALNAASLEKDMSASNVQIVQRADVDPRPIQPRPKVDLAIAIAVALLMSVAAVLLIEQADRRVRSIHALRPVVAGPIIGVLPRVSKTKLASIQSGEMPIALTEAYNLASANLTLAMRQVELLSGSHNRVIMVTSGLPGEGKSLSSAALARALARTSKRVVLIDADMRRPSQKNYYPSDVQVGLCDVLQNKISVPNALATCGIKNMRVLHAGSPTDDATQLIAGNKMTEILTGLKNSGCTVVIDTPASSVVADALLLAPHVDCILCVVGADQADEETVRSTTASLRAAAPKMLAYLLNRAEGSARQSSYYDYYAPASPAAAEDASIAVIPADLQHDEVVLK